MTTAAGIRVPALPLAVAGAAALWLFGFQTSVGGPPTDPPPDLGYYLQMGIVWVCWLHRGWLPSTCCAADGPATAEASSAPDRDLAAQLVAFAVLTLPEDRQLLGCGDDRRACGRCVSRPARWRFAAGCVRAALFPPSLQPGSIRRLRARPRADRHRGSGLRLSPASAQRPTS